MVIRTPVFYTFSSSVAHPSIPANRHLRGNDRSSSSRGILQAAYLLHHGALGGLLAQIPFRVRTA